MFVGYPFGAALFTWDRGALHSMCRAVVFRAVIVVL